MAECTGADVTHRGNKTQVVLMFETDDSQTTRMWIEVPAVLTPSCRYVRLAELAMGRGLRAGEPIHPENVFMGRGFRVMVGWRKSERDNRGKQKFDDKFANVGPKDERDFLRVHDLLERVEPCP